MSKRISRRTAAVLIVMSAALAPTQLSAQAPGRGGPPQAPKAAAPIDLTGYWVSVVTEDWRYRMVVPAPGDYQGVPMTADAVKVADAWDPAKDEAAGDQCKSFGAPALLRVPEHLHISWDDDNTLRMDVDAGTRLVSFASVKRKLLLSQPGRVIQRRSGNFSVPMGVRSMAR